MTNTRAESVVFLLWKWAGQGTDFETPVRHGEEFKAGHWTCRPAMSASLASGPGRERQRATRKGGDKQRALVRSRSRAPPAHLRAFTGVVQTSAVLLIDPIFHVHLASDLLPPQPPPTHPLAAVSVIICSFEQRWGVEMQPRAP